MSFSGSRLFGAMLFISAAMENGAAAGDPYTVFAAVPPHAGLTERLGAPWAAAEVLVQPDQDPHTFEPTPRQMNALSGAKLLITARMPFEKNLITKLRDAMPGLAVIDPGEGIAWRMMECSNHAGHEAHETPDPHIWLGPGPLAIQAKNIAAALSRTDPAHAAEYARNLAAFLQELETVDHRVRARLAPYAGRTFLVFHPAFGYFADAYGLKQMPVEFEGKSPTPRQMQEFAGQARAAKTKVVFIQPQYDPKSGEAIAAAIGGRTAMLDSLNRDVLANLEEIAGRLAGAFQD